MLGDFFELCGVSREDGMNVANCACVVGGDLYSVKTQRHSQENRKHTRPILAGMLDSTQDQL